MKNNESDTPVGQYLWDKTYHQRDWETQNADIVIVTDDGKERRLTTPNVRKVYPELARYLEGFGNVFDAFEDDERAREVLTRFEDAVIGAESAFELLTLNMDIIPPRDYDRLGRSELAKEPIAGVVQEWFYGRLDKNSEENDYILTSYMYDKIAEYKSQIGSKEMCI